MGMEHSVYSVGEVAAERRWDPKRRMWTVGHPRPTSKVILDFSEKRGSWRSNNEQIVPSQEQKDEMNRK